VGTNQLEVIGRCSLDKQDAQESAKVEIPNLAGLIRHRVFNSLTPLLMDCDKISSSSLRISMQAQCLRVIEEVELLIQEYLLDKNQKV